MQAIEQKENKCRKLLKVGTQIFLQDFLRMSVVAIAVVYAKGGIGDILFLSTSIVVSLMSSSTFLYVNYSRKASTHKVKIALAKLKRQEGCDNIKEPKKDNCLFYFESSAKLFSAVGAVVASFLYKKGMIKEWSHFLLSLLFLLLGSIAMATMVYDRQENHEDARELLQIAKNKSVVQSDTKTQSKTEKVFWSVAFIATIVVLNATSNALGIFYASGKVHEVVFLTLSVFISAISSVIFVHNINQRRKSTRRVKESVQLLSTKEDSIPNNSKTDWIFAAEISSRVVYTVLSVAAPFLYKKDIIGVWPYYCLFAFSMLFGAVLELSGAYDRVEMTRESDKLLQVISCEPIESDAKSI